MVAVARVCSISACSVQTFSQSCAFYCPITALAAVDGTSQNHSARIMYAHVMMNGFLRQIIPCTRRDKQIRTFLIAR